MIIYRLALALILLGSTIILSIQLDPLLGIGQVILIIGTVLLRDYKRKPLKWRYLNGKEASQK